MNNDDKDVSRMLRMIAVVEWLLISDAFRDNHCCSALNSISWIETKAKKNIDKIVSEFERHDDKRFREALIRDAEIRDVESINEEIDVI
jgi:hypothetical protein